MILLGVDCGEKRTGVAICDSMGILASPVTVIHEANKKKLALAVTELAKEKRADKIILGLPLRTDGTKGDKAQACEAFAALLRDQHGLDVVLWDERFSSTMAHQSLGAANVKAKDRRSIVDAVAACVILQSYLDRR
ncbi:MAG: Holliday junction resolvase RuvX [Oscillospiraceae bacterium]|nr:Holliday junction resolvase RuvX [Oscillospiraceae bacterium]